MKLKALGNEKPRAHNAKYGAGDNQFGVKHGDIRVLVKRIQASSELAMALWETGNVDAQLVATLLIKPKTLSPDDLDRLVRSVSFVHVADWLVAYVVKQHPDKETLRQEWMATDDRWAARAGWSLTAERVVNRPEGLDLAALLDRLESEMEGADPVVQWTMNSTRRKSASASPSCASGPSPLERGWGSIGTIPFRRAAPRRSRRSGSKPW